MKMIIFAAVALGCAGQVESTPADDCGPMPELSECTESGFVDYCGEPQLACDGWESPWGGDPDKFTRYYSECDGEATLWVLGPENGVVCSERWAL